MRNPALQRDMPGQGVLRCSFVSGRDEDDSLSMLHDVESAQNNWLSSTTKDVGKGSKVQLESSTDEQENTTNAGLN